MLSKAMQYALLALIRMASTPDQDRFGVAELSKSLDVSRTYLAKVLQNLARAGYLSSTTGPGGGFGFLKAPEEITLIELVRLMDGDRLDHRCFMGLSACSDEDPCPVHSTWSVSKQRIIQEFSTTTVADAARTSLSERRLEL